MAQPALSTMQAPGYSDPYNPYGYPAYATASPDYSSYDYSSYAPPGTDWTEQAPPPPPPDEPDADAPPLPDMPDTSSSTYYGHDTSAPLPPADATFYPAYQPLRAAYPPHNAYNSDQYAGYYAHYGGAPPPAPSWQQSYSPYSAPPAYSPYSAPLPPQENHARTAQRQPPASAYSPYQAPPASQRPAEPYGSSGTVQQAPAAAAPAPASGGAWGQSQITLKWRVPSRAQPTQAAAVPTALPLPPARAALAATDMSAGGAGPSIQTPGAAQTAAQARGEKYPDSLKEWIRRGFFLCSAPEEREAIQRQLKPIIQAAEAAGVIWSRDWDTYPLPSVGVVPPQPASPPRAKRARAEGAAAPRAAKAARVARPGDDLLAMQEARASRFSRERRALAAPLPDSFDADGDDVWAAGDVVVQGSCRELEKSYLRLTSAPNPALVRPEAVLEAALERLVALIRDGARDYQYCWSQFKAIRQDMTVQRVRNALTVRVYEAHARAALVYGDMKEYNSCATQLGLLYDAGCEGCAAEFGAYRILANSVQARCDSEGVLRALRMTLAPGARLAETPEVRHALAVRIALATSNYVALWRLYFTAPHLGRAILSQALRPLRHAVVAGLVKACKPTVDMGMCVKMLGFGVPAGAVDPGLAVTQPLPGCRECNVLGDAYPAAEAAAAAAACVECLREHGAVVREQPGGPEAWLLDCKESAGKVVMPEDKKAVAHGDANFSVDDFLSKVSRSR